MKAPDECPHDLIYVSDEEPGYIRKRCGRGFVYVDERGKRVTEAAVIERIKGIVIPPMWQKVWICKRDNGHLQVTGLDAKGRKQYIYHPLWVEFRQNHKFTKLLEFGESLPVIRTQIEQDVRKRSWCKEKILAAVVMLLDSHFLRIGNATYEKQNQTYGITTLKKEHLSEEGRNLVLKYKAKSGKLREVKIHSKTLVRLIKGMSELPGQEIFHYLDEHQQSQPLNSHDVNQYLRDITGHYFTAKDFRTWGGTVLAIKHYAEALAEVQQNPRRKLEKALVSQVAKVLGNTVSVCREYYIHPKVLKALLDSHFEACANGPDYPVSDPNKLSDDERLALKLIACP